MCLSSLSSGLSAERSQEVKIDRQMPLTASQNTVSSISPASGVWTGCLITVLPCFLERSFSHKKKPGHKQTTLDIWYFDLNFVIAYVYPLIVVGSFLRSIKYYTSPNLREEDIGSLIVNILIVRIGLPWRAYWI